ncbi:MAG TPA: thioredoxin family protein [Burkholderiales bacterium]|nr:thioredoxin family protein [Burkholderiales bacterium]
MIFRFPFAAALALQLGLALAFAPSSYELPAWFKQSFLLIAEDIEEATAKDKRIILFFGQNGCPYCKKLVEVNFSDDEIVAYTRKHFEVIALNIFGAREVLWVDGKTRPEKELATHLKVRATPTLIFLDEKGNIVERLTGYDPPEEFLRLLKRVAAN